VTLFTNVLMGPFPDSVAVSESGYKNGALRQAGAWSHGGEEEINHNRSPLDFATAFLLDLSPAYPSSR
jgi:hypothetical protein